jgi:hypothetical protein
VLFSTTAQPGWKDARWLGAYFVNSALLLGASELLVIAAIRGDGRAIAPLAPAVGILALLNLVPLGLLANDLHPLLSRLYSPTSRAAASVLVVFGGAVVPLGVLLFGSGLGIASAVFVAIVLANLGVRFVLLRLPHVATARGNA